MSTGLYRAVDFDAAGKYRDALQDRIQQNLSIYMSDVLPGGTYQFGDGSAGRPSISFANDTNTGRYRIGADNVGESAGGTLRFDWNTTRIDSTILFWHPDGTVTAPAVAFRTNTDVGLYLVAASNPGWTLDGVAAYDWDSTRIYSSTLKIRLGNSAGWNTRNWIEIDKTVNDIIQYAIRNQSTGASAQAGYYAINSGNKGIFIGVTSTGWVGAPYSADQCIIATDSGQELLMATASTKTMRFAPGNTVKATVDGNGMWAFNPIDPASGSTRLFNFTSPSRTGLTETDVTHIAWTLATSTFAGTGATISDVTAFRIAAPTYDSSVAGEVITRAATFYIGEAPIAGSGNITITNAYAIWVDGGNVRFDNNILWLSGTAFVGTFDHAITADRTWTFPDGSGTVSFGGGSGAANRVAWWSDANTLTSTSGFEFNTAAVNPIGVFRVAASLATANSIVVTNTNVGASAHGAFYAQTDGGDAFITFGRAVAGAWAGTDQWSVGWDQSANAFIIEKGTGLTGTGFLKLGTTGLFTLTHSDATTSPAVDIVQSSTGDAGIRLALGTTASYIWAIDNDASDALVLAYAASGTAVAGTNNRLVIDTSGNIGFGVSTVPSNVRCDILTGSSSTWALRIGDNATDATLKQARIVHRHYTNAEEDVMMLYGVMDATNNELNYGGGSSGNNAATKHIFYTAANNTTVTGTERARITSRGNILLGTTTDATAGDGKVLIFGDNAADPTLGASTGAIYGKTVAATVEMFARDSGGASAQLTPHHEGLWAPLMTGGYDQPWKRYHVEKMIRFLEKHFGETWIEQVEAV